MFVLVPVSSKKTNVGAPLDERIDAAAKSFESVREVSGNTNAAPRQGGANMETEEEQ